MAGLRHSGHRDYKNETKYNVISMNKIRIAAGCDCCNLAYKKDQILNLFRTKYFGYQQSVKKLLTYSRLLLKRLIA